MSNFENVLIAKTSRMHLTNRFLHTEYLTFFIYSEFLLRFLHKFSSIIETIIFPVGKLANCFLDNLNFLILEFEINR